MTPPPSKFWTQNSYSSDPECSSEEDGASSTRTSISRTQSNIDKPDNEAAGLKRESNLGQESTARAGARTGAEASTGAARKFEVKDKMPKQSTKQKKQAKKAAATVKKKMTKKEGKADISDGGVGDRGRWRGTNRK